MKRSAIQRGALSVLLLFTSVQCGISIAARYRAYLEKGHLVPSFLLISSVLFVGTLGLLTLIWKPDWFCSAEQWKARYSWLRRVSAAILLTLPIALYIFHPWSEPFGAVWIRVFLYGVFLAASSWILSRGNSIAPGALISCAFFFSVLFLLTAQFRDVTAYPFSVGWSEGNRFWDYSVLFGRNLYQWNSSEPIPAYIDLGRQSLWGAIFLLPRVTIVMMRAWNDILFTAPYALLGYALVRPQSSRKLKVTASLGTMLFLSQGPIYTPLVLAALLVAIGRKLPFCFGCLLTALAGAYAVMSRSTWFAAPAVLAGMLYLADYGAETLDGAKVQAKARWGKAVLAGVSGLMGAVIYLKWDMIRVLFAGKAAIPAASAAVAPQVADVAAPSMLSPAWFQFMLSRHPLLWDRLFPNETYAPGILLGVAAATVPLIYLLFSWKRAGKWHVPWQRTVVLLAGVIGFLLIGLVISVKIGGGSNLHNLDMFLLAFLFLAAIAWNAGMGEWAFSEIRKGSWLVVVILTALLLPVSQSALHIAPKRYPDPSTTHDALEKINEAVEAVNGERVLFLDQRQLLTFGSVPKIPLIADYEKKWMMDEAMGDHADWFTSYHDDLREHRFNLIISEPLQIKFQGTGLNFSEENDLFVKWVSVPTLCYYEPTETFDAQGVQLLVPRTTPLDQPRVICP